MSISNVKLGRNDKCHCSSGKKYKSCCLITDETKMKELRQEQMEKMLEEQTAIQQNSHVGQCMTLIREEFPEYKVMDVTPYINGQNYKKYQLQFYNKRTVMVAEKTEDNESVFNGRVDVPLNDMIVMYNGSYRTFQFKDLSRVMASIIQMINK